MVFRAPDIKISKMHGLSTENAAKLLDELSALAQKLCGEVMIFELAQHVQVITVTLILMYFFLRRKFLKS